MRRPSPFILPALLVLALGAYLLPAAPPEVTYTVPTPKPAPLPGDLPAETKALFAQSRPATVRVESLNDQKGSGGIGTGFFIDAEGHLLTAYHVVSDGQRFRITTLSGKQIPVRVLGFDAQHDVAMLETLRGGPYPFLKLTTRAPRDGETVLAIGNSDGDYLQPRRGQLLRQNVAAGRADFPQSTLEMTAPLAPGDSGGPIIDGNGQAIGVVSYIRQSANGETFRSYAVPVIRDSELIKALLAGEKRDTPVLGLVLDPTHSGMTKPSGAVILRVARGSPAEKAGLRGCTANARGQVTALGDVVIAVNDTPTPDANVYLQTVQNFKIGDSITVTYLRDGQQLKTTLQLAARSDLKDLNDNGKGPC